MQRFHQILLIVSATCLSWLGMMAVHELGHVLGAWSSGGVVKKVVLHPLAISRTDLSHNPRPLIVAWAGPAFGTMTPLMVWLAAAAVKLPGAWLLRFFAGFCLIANGVYLGAGSFDRIGDAGDLLRHSAAMGHLWGFGVLGLAGGLSLWNGLGPDFGWGGDTTSVRLVSPVAAYGCLGVLIVVVLVEVLIA